MTILNQILAILPTIPCPGYIHTPMFGSAACLLLLAVKGVIRLDAVTAVSTILLTLVALHMWEDVW